jgi:hypothetical protein
MMSKVCFRAASVTAAMLSIVVGGYLLGGDTAVAQPTTACPRRAGIWDCWLEVNGNTFQDTIEETVDANGVLTFTYLDPSGNFIYITDGQWHTADSRFPGWEYKITCSENQPRMTKEWARSDDPNKTIRVRHENFVLLEGDTSLDFGRRTCLVGCEGQRLTMGIMCRKINNR